MLWGNCEEIVYMDNDAIIVIAGNLNRLNCAKLESDCGLSQLVDLNTRDSVTLDKFLTNRPDQCLVVLLKLIIRQFWLNLRLVSPVIFHARIHRLLLKV